MNCVRTRLHSGQDRSIDWSGGGGWGATAWRGREEGRDVRHNKTVIKITSSSVNNDTLTADGKENKPSKRWTSRVLYGDTKVAMTAALPVA